MPKSLLSFLWTSGCVIICCWPAIAFLQDEQAKRGQQSEFNFKLINPSQLDDLNLGFIFFSRDGKMWAASGRGLAAFDGSTVTFYNNAEELPDLGTERINCIAEDKHENLWIGTNEKGVNLFNTKTGKTTKIKLIVGQDNAGDNLTIRRLFIDDTGKVWIGTAGRGFFIYDPESGLSKHHNLEHNDIRNDFYKNSVTGFVQDRKKSDKVWLGTCNGMYEFNTYTNELKRNYHAAAGQDSTFDNYVMMNMDAPRNDTIWFCTYGAGIGWYDVTSGGYKVFPNNSGKKSTTLKNHGILTFCRRSDTELYVACVDYLPAIFNTRSYQYTYLHPDESKNTLKTTPVVCFDQEKNLWISMGNRLFLCSPLGNLFKEIDISFQLIPNYYFNEMRDIFWDSSSQQYYASIHHSSGVYVYDSAFKRHDILAIPQKSGLYQEPSVFKTRKDGSGRIWTLGDEFYVWVEPRQKFEIAYTIFPELPALHRRIEDFLIDGGGNLILLTSEKQIYTISHAHLQVDSLMLRDTSLTADLRLPATVLYDPKGKMIYASGRNAIFQYRPNTGQFQWLAYNPKLQNRLSEPSIHSMALDHKGNLWIASAVSGIHIYEPSRLERVRELTVENSGIPTNAAITLKQGPEGYMLLETSNGILVYNIDQFTYVKLGMENGLHYDRSWGVNAANNKIFISMQDVVQYASLSDVLSMIKNLKPRMRGIMINGKQISRDSLTEYTSRIMLPYHQNALTLSFSALEFQFPERVRYTYKLDGVDRDWNLADNTNRAISYAGLSPGKYQFRLRAKLQGNPGDGGERVITFVILPPFWKTWWFLSLSGVSAMALLIWFISKKVKRIKEKEKEKALQEQMLLEVQRNVAQAKLQSMKLQMNPHFLFNSLNSIEQMILTGDADSATLYLAKFSKLLRIVLTQSEKEYVSLREELLTLELYIDLEGMRFKDNFHYEITCEGGIDQTEVKIPTLLIQPFVENAIWHGLLPKEGLRKISVHFSEDDEHTVQCEIEDNGVGRSTSQATEHRFVREHLHTGKGIHVTEQRINLFNQRYDGKSRLQIIDLKDERGAARGTKVVITFPDLNGFSSEK